jgi:hypothetical protein
VIRLLAPESAHLLDEHRPQLLALFRERYGAPPWNESDAENAQAVAHLIEAARAPATRTAIACGADGGLVGVCQGAPGNTFLADLRGVLPGLADSLRAPVFELRQLAVTTSCSGAGLGGRLHDEVMSAVAGPALLLTHPLASAAGVLYARRGWVDTARVHFGPEHPRDIWLLRRPDDDSTRLR